jgi:hypothetical protein
MGAHDASNGTPAEKATTLHPQTQAGPQSTTAEPRPGAQSAATLHVPHGTLAVTA